MAMTEEEALLLEVKRETGSRHTDNGQQEAIAKVV